MNDVSGELLRAYMYINVSLYGSNVAFDTKV